MRDAPNFVFIFRMLHPTSHGMMFATQDFSKTFICNWISVIAPNPFSSIANNLQSVTKSLYIQKLIHNVNKVV